MTEETLFDLILKTPESERAALLSRACEGKPELRLRIEALLKADAVPAKFLEQPAAFDATTGFEATASYAAGDAAGVVIAGRYKLLEEIGEGGMGTVWMAQQSEPVKRLVAIKLIKAGMDSKAVLARFEAERQALAMMDHPNIAKVLDGGLTGEPGGVNPRRPYFVMELVKGTPITKFCDERKVSLKERLELFVPVCQAIQHAHQKGVIHRDIKPSNVLIALYDDKPVPKVIDFGVAKATGAQLTEQTLNTGFGAVVGTPEYMSPEQASLNNLDIDTRSDVYALGVLLYELLTGTTPVDRKSLKQAALMEVLRMVREVEAPRPSTRLSSSEALPSIAANRHTEPIKLSKLMKGELDWIVMKALEKDRSRRYETANGFAADVLRYLSGEPVTAVPPSAGYRLKKFLKKNKGPALAASMVFLTLLAGIAGTVYGLIRADQRREDAEKAQRAEEGQRKIAEVEKQKAQKAEDDTLNDYRASSDDAIQQLIGSKQELGLQEKSYLKNALKRWQAFAARVGNDERSRAIQAEGLLRVANIRSKLGEREEAMVGLREAISIYGKLANEFSSVSQYRQYLATSHGNLGTLLNETGQLANAESHLVTALEIREKLAADFPAIHELRREWALSHDALAIQLIGHGKRAEAEVHLRKALNLYEKLVAENPIDAKNRHGYAGAHCNLALLFADLGKLKETQEHLRLAMNLDKQLAQEYPDEPTYMQSVGKMHLNLGSLQTRWGKFKEAEDEFKKCLPYFDRLANEYPSIPLHRVQIGKLFYNLGTVAHQQGKQKEAVAQCERAVDIFSKLARDYPSVPEHRSDFSYGHTILGDMLSGNAAIKQYQSALEVLEKLVSDYPKVHHYRKLLGECYQKLGIVLAETDKTTEAEVNYRKAQLVLEQLVSDAPLVPENRYLLVNSLNAQGVLLKNNGKRKESQDVYLKALQVCEKLVEEYPSVPQHQIQLGGCYCNFGSLLRAGGDPATSLEWFTKAIAILEKHSVSGVGREYLRNSFTNRAGVYDQLKQYENAACDWDQVLKLITKDMREDNKFILRSVRARSHFLAGHVDLAMSEYDELSKSSKLPSSTCFNYACIYALASSKDATRKEEYAQRAVELLNKAVLGGFRQKELFMKNSDLDPLRNREDFKKVIDSLNQPQSLERK